MSALPAADLSSRNAAPATSRVVGIGVLRALLLGEALAGLGMAIVLSMLAGAANDGGEAGRIAEQNLRFAAGFSFLFAILAALSSRGARRRRGWSWTLAALLQLLLSVGTGIAILVAPWHPAYLIGFGLAAVVMLVLSTPSVRRALGQE
jgi:hypothetical protein